MYDASREALGFIAGRTRSDLDRDRLLALGLVKCIEIIGEAANRISAETQQRFPEIPWRGIIAMRHRTVHGYADVDLHVVWQTVSGRLPELISAVEAAIRALGQSEGDG